MTDRQVEESGDEIDDQDEASSTSVDAADDKESLDVDQNKNPEENTDNSEGLSDDEEVELSNDIDFNEGFGRQRLM